MVRSIVHAAPLLKLKVCTLSFSKCKFYSSKRNYLKCLSSMLQILITQNFTECIEITQQNATVRESINEPSQFFLYILVHD